MVGTPGTLKILVDLEREEISVFAPGMDQDDGDEQAIKEALDIASCMPFAVRSPNSPLMVVSKFWSSFASLEPHAALSGPCSHTPLSWPAQIYLARQHVDDFDL